MIGVIRNVSKFDGMRHGMEYLDKEFKNIHQHRFCYGADKIDDSKFKQLVILADLDSKHYHNNFKYFNFSAQLIDYIKSWEIDKVFLVTKIKNGQFYGTGLKNCIIGTENYEDSIFIPIELKNSGNPEDSVLELKGKYLADWLAPMDTENNDGYTLRKEKIKEIVNNVIAEDKFSNGGSNSELVEVKEVVETKFVESHTLSPKNYKYLVAYKR